MSKVRPTLPKTIWLFISLAICFSTVSQAGDKSDKRPELTLLTWSEYLDPELTKKFEKKYHIKVKEIFFENDDARDEMLISSEGRGYDLILLNGLMLERYVKRGWLEKLALKNIPNIRYIDKKWRTAFSKAETHAVPYFWGTLGIAYRKDLVSQPVTSWQQLYNPSRDMQGKIMMMNGSRDLLSSALKSLGYSLNSTNKNHLNDAGKLLQKQKPFVKEYNVLTLSDQSSIVKGTIVAAMSYSGDAILLQDFNENIVYVLPDEGGQLWVDYFAVAASSKKKKLAYQFLNFINEPKNAAQLAQFVYYATPNTAAEKLLPAEFLNNKSIYPDQAALKNSEYLKKLPHHANKKISTIYSRIAD